ncbi:MAG: N-(5'-phosphoribosyl)anthranilate isomerase, partial [Moraxella osloensis]|nr:N-(5'-phosphoribosyl)anthranilate isomerase [Moraxella osloensis]
YGVDVSGGIESAKGVKSLAKMQKFIEQTRK